MKLINYKYNNKYKFGFLVDNRAVSMEDILENLSKNDLDSNLASDIVFIENFYNNKAAVKDILDELDLNRFLSIDDVELLSPIKKPTSLRDAYAFRQHVEAGRKSRNLPMIPEYDEFPVYYYSNHNAVSGPGNVSIQIEHAQSLDYELEIAAVIGKKGKNIKVEDADDYILGYTIMNDFSARQVQKKEMKMSLGPAKGKDFLTCLGPFIVTKDELDKYIVKNISGDKYNLKMTARLNGELLSEDNFKNITWTFAQIISQISIGTTIYPGDVIGSGTCATGCLLEINQTNNTDIWLKDGDEISLSIDGLGTLTNTITIK